MDKIYISGKITGTTDYMEGWEDSKGAKMEHQRTREDGKIIFYER